jgi:triacylglycerol lipase
MTYRPHMALVRSGIDRLATLAGAARSAASGATGAGRYVLRTFGTPAGARALVIEGAWLAARTAVYPLGLVDEEIRGIGAFRTEELSPVQRSLVVTDVTAAGTPILLVHGIMDNRSVFTVFRRALRRRGFGVVHAVNYSLLTGDLRHAAHELRARVERLRERTGAEKVHIVGHSLGGMIARYYVQRLRGHEAVDTLVTLGSPHAGTTTAHLLPTPLARQLRPRSDLIAELAEPAPGCTTRFLVVWSRMDQLVLPQRNARLAHPDLDVEQLELRAVGHLALPLDPRTVHWVGTGLARPRAAATPIGSRSAPVRHPSPEVRGESSPAS